MTMIAGTFIIMRCNTALQSGWSNEDVSSEQQTNFSIHNVNYLLV